MVDEKFQPVTLTIIITSRDELFELYNKCRLSSDIMPHIFENYGYVDNLSVIDKTYNHTGDLGQVLRKIIKERSLG